MKLLDKLKETWAAGDGEFSRDDVLREVERGILALARRGVRGRETFPPSVLVTITAAEGGVETLRGFVTDPSFERDLEARLQNRLLDPQALPARRYTVALGDRPGVAVAEDATTVQGSFVVTGGDRDGSRYPVELSRKEWRVGRGPWHQERPNDQRLPNDIVATDSLAWVSRAAAIVRRSGAFLEVESRQQGDFLLVVRKDGTQLRPAMTASGRIPLAFGDRLVLHDGGAGRVELRLEPLGGP